MTRSGDYAQLLKALCIAIGKASDQPPGGAADMPEKDSMKWRHGVLFLAGLGFACWAIRPPASPPCSVKTPWLISWL